MRADAQTAGRVACFTSFTFSYLSKARLLAWSLKRFHKDWHFVAVITDELPPGMDFLPDDEPFDEVIWGQELPIPNIDGWLFKHDVVEVCTAVKGPVLDLLVASGYDKVFYLDPDIAVFNSLTPVVELLDSYPIVLTPHQLQPDVEKFAIIDNEICSLKHGIYNLGFVAIQAKGEGARFARWWKERLVEHCYDDIPNGLFTDQRWCDHVPVFFDDVHILKDPGYNVASWNLSRRKPSVDLDGNLLVNGVPLRFYHVTKFGPVGEAMTSRYAGPNSVVYEIWRWYRQKLSSFSSDLTPAGWWRFGVYDSGEPIEKDHRLLYRTRQDLQRAFPNPFSTADGGFKEWLTRSMGW